tara:strand:- start:60 stop:536 length:477 start_codon:yes stop_codon:yes gene_type:complete
MRNVIRAAVVVFAMACAAPVSAKPLLDALVAYYNGDYVTALRLWRPLAEQGDTDAQFSLAQMYYKGQGVPQDYNEALKLYRKAAEQGNAEALYTLGLMYDDGQGVPQDYVEAHRWFNLSAAKGNTHAGKHRDMLAREMTPAQIAEAQKLAREWRPKAQ